MTDEIDTHSDSIIQWEKAQIHETKYYSKRSSVAGNKLYANLRFWKCMLEVFASKTRVFLDTDIFIDFGCGPNSILSALPIGEKIAVDPLMDFYLEKFKMVDGIHYVKGTAENYNFGNEHPNFAFLMNSLDHTQNPVHVVKRIANNINNAGFCIISLNCHKLKISKMIFSKFYKIIDPPHPHHFTAQDVIKLFRENGFRLCNQFDENACQLRANKSLLYFIKHKIIFKNIYFVFQEDVK